MLCLKLSEFHVFGGVKRGVVACAWKGLLYLRTRKEGRDELFKNLRVFGLATGAVNGTHAVCT